MGDIFAGVGETLRGALWDSPPLRIGLLLFLALVASLMITAPEPPDFSKTGRFHLWVATVGATLVVGSTMIWTWPGFDYDRGAPVFDWAMRICAVAFYALVIGRAVRKRMTARQTWVKAEIERLGTAEWTEQITAR
ncbi:hypothetical protein DC31_05785 [Microbacterium sp. CH12i]|uniref:hypothetical protein n=1 Tax=Microbacterium sp. CH12i TaxID=1479651 RepID=UPI000461465B|nr:hypothetical protein [Microbacterium sp. CH12i]KDA04646.1 hypothetical protein DC31_05785 [Microbacterium sp. CH12i]